jgi:osmotically-inducible protein OsmY
MKVSAKLKLIGVSVWLAMGLAACDKPGPAETAGRNIDRSANEVGQKIDEAADKTGVAIDDAEITAKIKTAFLAESGLKTFQISVDTVKGVVTLSGLVDTQSHSDLAKTMAGAVSGVTKVNNDLVVKPKK